MDTFEDCEGAEDMQKESSALSTLLHNFRHRDYSAEPRSGAALCWDLSADAQLPTLAREPCGAETPSHSEWSKEQECWRSQLPCHRPRGFGQVTTAVCFPNCKGG